MDPEIEKKLASGEYSISPRTGRIRKKVRYRKNSIFSKRKLEWYGQIAVVVILVAAFIISLIIVIPELNLESEKNINAKRAKNRGL